MDPKLLVKLNKARKARQPVIHLTELASGRDRLVHKGDVVAGQLGEAIIEAFVSGKSGPIKIGKTKFFLNVYLPAVKIIVIGAVHISQALAPMAALAGFDLEIIDPRTAFATPERFEGIKLTADWPENVLKPGDLDAFTALVAVTHDPKIDDFAILEALENNAFYVGALGSRKTHAARLERLAKACKDTGLDEEVLDRIHAPIGFDIGAASPAEIAVAIMAEIIAVLRGRSGQKL